MLRVRKVYMGEQIADMAEELSGLGGLLSRNPLRTSYLKTRQLVMIPGLDQQSGSRQFLVGV